MTILLIIKHFDFGGAENHVCDLANMLIEKGHKVILIGRRGRQAGKLHPKIEYIEITLKDLLLPIHIIKLFFIIKNKKIDVIHAHQRLAILLASICGFLSGKKVIATVHGRAKYDLRHNISRRLLSKIIFVSTFVYEVSNKKYGLKHKSVFIPNGVNTIKTEYKPNPYRISYVSKINKSHIRFLKYMIDNVLPVLIKEYPDLEFNVVGDGKNISELRQIIQILNYSYKKDYCKLVGYEEIVEKEYLKSAVIMGVGRVALEAASIGVPVLLANSKRFGGLLSFENYQKVKSTNFIDVKSPKPDKSLIINTLDAFFKNQEEFYSEAKKLSVMIHKEFSLDFITDKIISIYTETAEKQ
ncbi:MAG: glycosyltransferase family 4 protein [Bacteroidota bacterium]